MKKSRFSEEQMVKILREADRMPIAEVTFFADLIRSVIVLTTSVPRSDSSQRKKWAVSGGKADRRLAVHRLQRFQRLPRGRTEALVDDANVVLRHRLGELAVDRGRLCEPTVDERGTPELLPTPPLPLLPQALERTPPPAAARPSWHPTMSTVAPRSTASDRTRLLAIPAG